MNSIIKKSISFLLMLMLVFSAFACVKYGAFSFDAAAATEFSIKKAPTLESSSLEANSVKLTWSKTKSATSYKLYSSTDKKNWKCLKTLTATSYKVTQLSLDKKYYFKVRAYQNKTASPYSSVITVTPKLSKVKSVSVKFDSKSQITVSWKSVPGASGYQVLLSTSSDFKSGNTTFTTDAKTLKRTIKSLKTDKTYYVKVRAIKKLNKKTYTGSYSNNFQIIPKSKVSYEYITQTVYATEKTNIRKGAGTSYAIVGTLAKGKSIKRTAIGSNGWSKVDYNGKTCYIFSKYLSTTKPAVTTKPSTSTSQKPVSDMVWISRTGSKYHCDPSCSNMKSPSNISLSDAKDLGLTACSKCY